MVEDGSGTLDVLVPREGRASHVARGSAIVGRRLPEGGWLADYEGGIHRREPWPFNERIKVAAGRARVGYPTVARGVIGADEADVVATYEARQLRFLSVADPDALAAWSGETLDEVVGVVAEPGPVAPERLAALDLKPSRIEGRAMWCLTRAGQLVHYDLPTRSATVHDRNDPAVPADVRARFDGGR